MGKIYRGWQTKVKILYDSTEIGEAMLCLSHVHIDIKTEQEPYYEIENPNVKVIVQGKQTISGTLTGIWINTAKLRLLGIPGAIAPSLGPTPKPVTAPSPFIWDSNLPFKLEIISAEETEAPFLELNNCKFIKVSISIPQDGWLEEDYDFISIGEPVVGTYVILTMSLTEHGITNPVSPGTYSFTKNSTAIISAFPESGYNFKSWTIDGIPDASMDNPLSLLMDDDHEVDAVFMECPECAIINGGFETGDWTGWTRIDEGDCELSKCDIIDYNKHTGNWSARLNYDACVETGCCIGQIFDPMILVNCITEFYLWAYNTCSMGEKIKITIYYDDAAPTEIEVATAFNTWVKIDILPYLTAGKTVDSIMISAIECTYIIDDVTLSC